MLDPKIQLDVTLTEPVVFLRSSDPSGRHQPDPNDPFTLVRGILNLNVTKPINVSCIEVALTGVLTIIRPEGIGAGRVEVPEQHKFFSSTVTIFRSGQIPRYGKRPASVGPGLGLSTTRQNDHGRAARTPASPPPSPREWSEGRSAESVALDLGPTPPYTPTVQSPGPTSIHSRFCAHPENPAQTLEELRQALRENIDVHLDRFSPPSSRRHSVAFSHVTRTTNASAFYASNDSLDNTHIDDLARTGQPLDNSSFHNDTLLSPSYPDRASTPESTHGAHSRTCDTSRDVASGRSRLRLSLSSVLDAVMEATTRASPRSRTTARSEERERGRSRARSIVDRQGGHTAGTENSNQHQAEHREHHLLGLGRVLGLERDHEKEKDGSTKSKEHDGWTEFKPGHYSYPISFLLPPNLPPTFSLPHASLNYTIKGVVHRPGTFTSKLSCQVPLLVVAAPTVGVGEGGDPGPLSVQKQWEGKLAYSLGLSSRLFLIGSQRHLDVVASEGIRESTESLVQAEVEARSEPQYGTVTLDLTLLPFEKIKIWKLGVVIDQRIKHLDEQGRLLREDDTKRVSLLELQDTCPAEEASLMDEEDQTHKNKHSSKHGFVQIPLLPTPLSPHRSPLLRYIPTSSDPSILAGPGPYTLSATVGLPSCNDPDRLQFTVKQKTSNVKVEHMLRLILRVENIGDQGTDDHGEGGKKKLFDIAVQTPITVLSCRCAPEYQTLPRYSQITQDSSSNGDRTVCPCQPRDSIVQLGAQDAEHHEHLPHHHVISTTRSSTSSLENEYSDCNGPPGPAGAPDYHVQHRHDQALADAEHVQQQDHVTHPERPRSPSRTRALGSGPMSPLLASHLATREDPHNLGTRASWSRSSSVHAHDRNSQTPSHGHSHLLHHPYHPHSRRRSGSHSRAQTPVTTPHTSRPPSPAPAQRYERLVSGLESDAGEAPPSYYESVTSSNF